METSIVTDKAPRFSKKQKVVVGVAIAIGGAIFGITKYFNKDEELPSKKDTYDPELEIGV